MSKLAENIFYVDRNIIIYAFRYALGRQSYAPSIVTDTIKNNIESISEDDISLFIREINECSDYGMNIDKEHWYSFRKYLIKELEKKRKNKN